MKKLKRIHKEYQKLSLKKDWRKYESNNKSIAFNILYVSHNTEKIGMHISQNTI